MNYAPRNIFAWWLALITAVTLPFSVNFAIKNIGGYFADYMYRSAFQTIIFACCWVAIFLTIKLLNAPQKLKAFRIFGMVSISVFLALASCVAMTSSSCQDEFIELAQLGIKKTEVAATSKEPVNESCG